MIICKENELEQIIEYLRKVGDFTAKKIEKLLPSSYSPEELEEIVEENATFFAHVCSQYLQEGNVPELISFFYKSVMEYLETMRNDDLILEVEKYLEKETGKRKYFSSRKELVLEMFTHLTKSPQAPAEAYEFMTVFGHTAMDFEKIQPLLEAGLKRHPTNIELHYQVAKGYQAIFWWLNPNEQNGIHYAQRAGELFQRVKDRDNRYFVDEEIEELEDAVQYAQTNL